MNSQTPGGVTPLHRAAYCGHVGVVTVLLEKGADVKLADSDGMTALHKVSVLLITPLGHENYYAVFTSLVTRCT